jgi:hypothetical protein
MSDVKILTKRQTVSMGNLLAETAGMALAFWLMGKIWIPFLSTLKTRAMIASRFYRWNPS